MIRITQGLCLAALKPKATVALPIGSQAMMHPKLVPEQLVRLWTAQVMDSVAKDHVVRVDEATTNQDLPWGKQEGCSTSAW